MNMAMSQQIAQTKSHHQAHQQGTEIRALLQDNAMDPHPIITIKIGTITMIIRTDIGLAGWDPFPTAPATGISQSIPWKSHSRSYHQPTYCSTSHQRNSSAYHYWWDTPHKRSSLHKSFSRDHSRSRPGISHKLTHKTSSKLSYISNCTTWKKKDRKYKQVTIDDSPSKYYSSDDQASKSDEDFN